MVALLQSVSDQSPFTALVWPISIETQLPPVGILPVFLWQYYGNGRPQVSKNIYQFVQLGVAASKSELISTPCHLKMPTSCEPLPFSPRVYFWRVVGSSNSSFMYSIRQSSSVLDSRTTSLPFLFPMVVVWGRKLFENYVGCTAFQKEMTKYMNSPFKIIKCDNRYYWGLEKSDDFSPCISNPNCPMSPHYQPLGRRLCTNGYWPLCKIKIKDESTNKSWPPLLAMPGFASACHC